MAESDASLVARARDGDAGSFEVLIRRHFRAAYVIALALTGEPADAEDVCQEAFVRCWERLADCRDPERFVAWLMRIVRNAAHNYRDYLAVRRAEPLSDALHAGREASPARAAARAELADRLRGALAELSETQREVVLLHDLDGWRHRDIAAALGISELMSRRHLSDARRALRSLLGGYAALEADHD